MPSLRATGQLRHVKLRKVATAYGANGRAVELTPLPLGAVLESGESTIIL